MSNDFRRLPRSARNHFLHLVISDPVIWLEPGANHSFIAFVLLIGSPFTPSSQPTLPLPLLCPAHSPPNDGFQLLLLRLLLILFFPRHYHLPKHLPFIRSRSSAHAQTPSRRNSAPSRIRMGRSTINNAIFDRLVLDRPSRAAHDHHSRRRSTCRRRAHLPPSLPPILILHLRLPTCRRHITTRPSPRWRRRRRRCRY